MFFQMPYYPRYSRLTSSLFTDRISGKTIYELSDGTMIARKADTLRELRDELFQKKGEGWFTVVSGSMRPLIEVNERVLVKRVTPSEVRPGDIILFKSDGVFVTHRVIRIDGKNDKPMVLQKGDASVHAGLIDLDAIVGKVTGIEKKGMLDLTSGRGRMLNRFLGMKSRMGYWLDARIENVRQSARNMPGFVCLRALYRIAIKPMDILQRILVKICT